LSSATRILATELPPMHPHKHALLLPGLRQPHKAIGASAEVPVNAK